MANSILTELGDAAGYAVLSLGGEVEVSGGSITGAVGFTTDGAATGAVTDYLSAYHTATIKGDVIYQTGGSFTLSSSSTISGTVESDAALSGTNSGTVDGSSGVAINHSPQFVDNAANYNAINSAYAAATSASTFFKGLTAAGTGVKAATGALATSMTGNVTLTGVSGDYNYVNLTSLNLNGHTLTLSGTAGTEFVINVSGAINVSSGSIVLAGGLTASDVIINETGTGQTITTGGTVSGILLAPGNAVTLVSGSTWTGAIIAGGGASGQQITIDGTLDCTICLLAGTMVATAAGGAAIEDLRPGDLVLTHDGREAPVLWVGRQTVSRRFADPLRSLPIRIKAGALGENLPARDLLVSPCHALLVDDVLVQAGALINGTSIVRETAMPETFLYYHVELADHAMILAEGVPAETFVDNVGRLAFDNWEEHLALFPEGREIDELPQPRVQSARQLPAAIADRLAARAAEIGESLVQAA
jgi:hypothetical protein